MRVRAIPFTSGRLVAVGFAVLANLAAAQVRDPNLEGDARTPERWFHTSAFALPAPFAFGSAPRNSVIGPDYVNLDFALAKTWALSGSRLEFRWEIFNLLNRANFDLPNRIFGTNNFGRIFSAKPYMASRQVQKVSVPGPARSASPAMAR